jgi:hypothetical protein
MNVNNNSKKIAISKILILFICHGKWLVNRSLNHVPPLKSNCMPDLGLGTGKAMKSVRINRAFCIMPTLKARAFVGKFAISFFRGGGTSAKAFVGEIAHEWGRGSCESQGA